MPDGMDMQLMDFYSLIYNLTLIYFIILSYGQLPDSQGNTEHSKIGQSQ